MYVGVYIVYVCGCIYSVCGGHVTGVCDTYKRIKQGCLILPKVGQIGKMDISGCFSDQISLQFGQTEM